MFSIPRFKHTGDVKGFAFVEFESAKEAQEAVEVFDFILYSLFYRIVLLAIVPVLCCY